jgi:hypothetical protein
MNVAETEANCVSQIGKAKSGIVSQIARLVRKSGPHTFRHQCIT